jgi:hypothetical protein
VQPVETLRNLGAQRREAEIPLGQVSARASAPTPENRHSKGGTQVFREPFLGAGRREHAAHGPLIIGNQFPRNENWAVLLAPGAASNATNTNGGVKVGTATGLSNVVKTDIKTKNGVIHVIDAVILP